MMISGILILTKEGKAEEVAKKIENIQGVEVHHIVEGSKIVITLEEKSIDQSYQTGKQLEKVPGVLGVNVVYYNFEEAEEALAEAN
ncbi:uncharacterized protein involved in formation of periplasmic nitrate reductase [Schinkia azotoformans MEV2011]|uniref:Chaperone NapD n=1 Tax=Schinkia azotoformans MEV2011 TaxID=1348973 RepID=A0A072NNB2_SCHAZ|nr:chaperone NapD [Schinkia azotoformans]KEF38747.1 uncharacterized protein involved in formation of periplasmic nitrate reductase [Schinkia azotoformans MEV2011]MEC1697024.1 chaperone NapD [Schinkia azotoformans]MEC1718063.1 chaperone NapD [Schinkia azotoformans]MEC1727037.1 chaperone NapD [Schinkia azotoformans]MEC1743520.1 chaperone NapD [Schinkia azotoformans]